MDMEKFFQETDFKAAEEKAKELIDEIDDQNTVEDEEGVCDSCHI